MESRKLRVGIIGANVGYGWAPRAHLPALLALPEFELAAVCTAHPETAAESAQHFGAPLGCADHEEMLRDADVDVVAVVVRAPLHHRLTMDALRAGKHVFTEWPLGANLKEAEEMADLARQEGVKTMVGLQGRCSPEVLKMRELIDEGYVGDVLSCHLSVHTPGVLSRTSDRIWAGDEAQGVTTLTIQFGHAIDSLCTVLGEFGEVSATVSTQVKQWRESDTGRMVDVTAPDNVMLSGRLESGVVVSAHVASVPWHGSGYRLEVYGREGTLVLNGQGFSNIGGLRLFGGRSQDSELAEVPAGAPSWVGEAGLTGAAVNVAQMWRHFGEAIVNGVSAEPDFELALARHRLIDVVQRSSAAGGIQVAG